MSLKSLAERGWAFVLRGQWTTDLQDFDRARKLAHGFLRTLTLAAYEFVRDKCSLRASWLTLVFIFSLAPALAIGFAVAKGFGAQERVQHMVYQTLNVEDTEGLPVPGSENIRDILDPMLQYVNRTNVGALGLVGLLLLLYTAYKLLSAIEQTLNEIWAVRRRRTLIRQVVDYVAVLSVFPLMLMLTALVLAALRAPAVRAALTATLPAPAVALVGALVAILSAFIGFWFLYYFFPNTRVPAISSLVGAFVAAASWFLLQYFFVRLQVGVAQYNAVYGTFATVPIFLLWMQSSWMVILFGAEVSFAHAHLGEFAHGGLGFNPSPAYREQVGLGITALAARRFAAEAPPLTAEAFARELAVPLEVVREVLTGLTAGRLLAETVENNGARYLPAVPLDQLTVGRVLRTLSGYGDEPLQAISALTPLGVHRILAAREKAMERFSSTPILEYVRAAEHAKG